MKKVNSYLSYDGILYKTEKECKEADVFEMLRRFVDDEIPSFGGEVTKDDIKDALVNKIDIIKRILDGDDVYLTDEEIKNGN